ncbi:hypothetical protein [Parvularcula oceani]|uniref:hypothetical protein n=1 Tax=Parvularcula oceani TaxID=1247963 RepID=UPI0004E0D9C8|nr:hypothetical protein [Parvularcula oceani]
MKLLFSIWFAPKRVDAQWEVPEMSLAHIIEFDLAEPDNFIPSEYRVRAIEFGQLLLASCDQPFSICSQINVIARPALPQFD